MLPHILLKILNELSKGKFIKKKNKIKHKEPKKDKKDEDLKDRYIQEMNTDLSNKVKESKTQANVEKEQDLHQKEEESPPEETKEQKTPIQKISDPLKKGELDTISQLLKGMDISMDSQ